MNKKNNIFITALSILWLCLALVSDSLAVDWISLAGYYKNFSVVYHMPKFSEFDLDSDRPWLGSVSNRVRINGYFNMHSNIKLNAAYNIAPRIQDHSLFLKDALSFNINPMMYRIDDFNRIFTPDQDNIRSFAIVHNLDRAFLTLTIPWADFYLGRQAIAWGSARMINPTDIIAPYAYTELDTEDRIGVDAFRIRIPIGFLGEVDLGYVAGQNFNFDNSALFVRGRYNLLKTDMSLMAAGFRENLMLGIDLARSIGNAGFWFESGYIIIDALSDNGNGYGDDYLQLSTGLDHSLGPNTYAFLEYYFNQAGSNNSNDYLYLPLKTAYREGATYLLGKHYLIPSVTHQITPLVNGNLSMLINLGDPSISITPNLEYNIAPNIYVSAGAYIGLGERPNNITEIIESPEKIFRSEFGSYPDLYYSSFRIYF